MLRRSSRQKGILLLQVFSYCTPLLLPGMPSEMFREKLSLRQ